MVDRAELGSRQAVTRHRTERGFARGEAKVALVAEDGGTRIDYSATAQVGGKLAQIGSRLVDAAASKVADEFFARFVERLGARPEAAAVRAPVSATRVGWWVAIAIIVLVAIYWLTTRG